MSSKIKILIGILVIIVIGIISWLIWNKIRPGINELYCEQDSDCIYRCGCKNKKFKDSRNILCKPIAGATCKCTNNRCETILPKKQEVTLATDKTDYVEGETVKITVTNNLNQDIWYWDNLGETVPLVGIQILQNGEWKGLAKKDACSCKENCTHFSNGLVDLKTKGIITDSWDTKTDCTGLIIEKGKYRALFTYYLDAVAMNKTEVYSEEFTIKYETSNWKTYKNEEFGFEIKYPSTFNFKEKQGGLFGIEFPKLNLGLIIERKPENFSDLENYLNTIAKEKNNDCKIEDGADKRYCYSVESKDFGGNKTLALIYRPLGGNSAAMGCIGIDVYFENDDYLSVASYGYCSVDFDENWSGPAALAAVENYNIIQQMLSTFRFLE
jgi:hypothetical protein